MIRDIHERYLAAGADLIETNTFGATTIAQEDYGMADLAREMNLRSAQLARAACDKYSTPDKPRYVAVRARPHAQDGQHQPRRERPRRAQRRFRAAARGLFRAGRGADRGWGRTILVETIFDTLNAKAALFAIEEVFDKTGERLPVLISGTVTTPRAASSAARRSPPSGTACATRARWPWA